MKEKLKKTLERILETFDKVVGYVFKFIRTGAFSV